VSEEDSLRSRESLGEQELEKEAINANEAGDSHTSASSMEPAGNRPPTAIKQIKTLEYIMLCTWFSFCLVPLQYYVGSIGFFQLEAKGDDGFYTDLFSITYAGATVVAPLGGYLADRYGLGITQGLATYLTATSLFILASDRISLNGQILGLVAYGMGRMFIFGMYFSNNGKRFGYTNYGTLVGLGLLISAIVSLIQYPLIALAAEGKAAAVNIACGATLLSLFPYFVWLHRRDKSTSCHCRH
jgi:MFS family permease